MNPVMLPVHEYRATQWEGFVGHLARLIRTGYDREPYLTGARILYGILPDEVNVARLDAHLRIQEDTHDAAA